MSLQLFIAKTIPERCDVPQIYLSFIFERHHARNLVLLVFYQCSFPLGCALHIHFINSANVYHLFIMYQALFQAWDTQLAENLNILALMEFILSSCILHKELLSYN